ncbi:MAG: DNA-binding response regulator [Actinobacteria bacterium]|nr:DNA-binding response regulator [Actinomycetota bacterium]
MFIVEDDPSVRTAVERVMSLEGYRTEVSPNGADALERIGAMRPDVAPQLEPSATVGVADLVVDTARREARRGDRRLELTKTEFDLLTVLAEQHGIVLSRDYLYEHIWGYHVETSSKSLDVYVGYLRRKLEEAGEPRLLHTVRGVGYVLREQE